MCDDRERWSVNFRNRSGPSAEAVAETHPSGAGFSGESWMTTRSILRFGALGAAVAFLMLIALAAVVAPIDFVDPAETILLAQLRPVAADLDRYIAVLPTLYAVDSIFIIGWIVGWLGVAALVRSRNVVLGVVALVLGLIGPVLDFVENGIAWTLIEGHRQGLPVPVAWYLAWSVARHLSLVIPYAAAAVAGVGLWSRKPLDMTVTGVGTVLAVVAIIGTYVPALASISMLWWFIWFFCIGLLLWRRAGEFSEAL